MEEDEVLGVGVDITPVGSSSASTQYELPAFRPEQLGPMDGFCLDTMSVFKQKYR